MKEPETPGPPRDRPPSWWTLAVAVLLLGAASVVGGLRGHPVPLAVPSPLQTAEVTVSPSTSPPPAVSRSAPVALRIPAIDLSIPLGQLGLNPDGTVEVPTDFADAGWFRLGPTPGQSGSAVILGHVDSYRGPAVFFRLASLRADDEVEVSLADGAVARFVVTAVETYPKDQFPGPQVYGSHGYSALQLVTCGGEFDPVAREYRSNVVVYTSLVALTST